MGDRGKIIRADATDQQADDIQDAEFVEIHEEQGAGPHQGAPPTRSRGCLFYAAVGGGLLVVLLLLTMCVAILAIPPDSGNHTDEQTAAVPDASNPESVACGRTDVLEIVSKETRSMLLKTALPNLVGNAALGLIDLDRFRANWEAASGKFSQIQLTAEPARDGPSLSVACIGSFRLDMSNATVGQDVLQLPQLRWIVNFADNDPASDNFTVKVDQASIYDGMQINGNDLAPPDEGGARSEEAEPASDAIPKLTKGEEYAGVRKQLLEAGFVPVSYSHRDCSPYGTAAGEACYDRAEIYFCSGTGQGFCSAYWRRGDEFLSVLIAEGPNGRFESAKTMSRSDLVAVLAQDGETLSE